MSQLFLPFRALGHVCNELHFAVQYKKFRNEFYISTTIDNRIHTYKLSNLGLTAISHVINDISQLATDERLLFCSSGHNVYSIIQNCNILHKFVGSRSLITNILPYGDFLVASNDLNEILMWHIDTEDLQMIFSVNPSHITTLLHPFAYRNKLLIGCGDGSLQLWNLSRVVLLHTFSAHIMQCMSADECSRAKDIQVTVLKQAPALHVVAVGFANGRIVLLHLKQERVLSAFQLDWGEVTSITFRMADCVSNAAESVPQLLLVGSSAGHVTLWELANGRLIGEVQGAHAAPVTGLECIRGQPLLVTSAGDNCLRVWLWDAGHQIPRLLHQRQGHSAPPTVLLYLDQSGRSLVSSGLDSTVRLFSTEHERHNRCLGRAVLTSRRESKKIRSSKNKELLQEVLLPPVTCMSTVVSHQSDWDVLVCLHENDVRASTWNVQKKCMGKHLLKPSEMSNNERLFKKTVATSVAVTFCGNFVIIGYSSGHVVRFNLQSGLERSSYPQKVVSMKPKTSLPLNEACLSLGDASSRPDLQFEVAHNASVVGVACDNLNRVVVSAGGKGCGALRFYHFKSAVALGECVQLRDGVTRVCVHQAANQLAAALTDGRVVLVDMIHRRVVRRLAGHPGGVTALCFSPSAGQLVTTGSDCLIRTWDVLEGRLVDSFRVESPVTAITWSPSDDLLATCHRGRLGVHLWTNRALYTSGLVLTPLPDNFVPPEDLVQSLPAYGEEVQTEEPLEEAVVMEIGRRRGDSVAQLAENCLTLSGTAESRWKGILHLDEVRERGRPVAAAVQRAPEAPFFLPSLSQKQSTVKLAEEKEVVTDSSSTMDLDSELARRLRPVAMILQDEDADIPDNVWEPLLMWMESLSVSAADAELLSLASCSSVIWSAFLRTCSSAFTARRHWDTANAYLSAFLRHNGVSVASQAGQNELLRCELEKVQKIHETVESSVNNLTDEIDSMLTFYQTGMLGQHLS